MQRTFQPIHLSGFELRLVHSQNDFAFDPWLLPELYAYR